MEIGRWLTRDPMEDRDSPNVNLFVHNNPITSIDWLGMLTWNNNPTMWTVSTIVSRGLSFGSIRRWEFTPSDMAMTVPRMRINFDCCPCALFFWKLCPSGITVNFKSQVYIRPSYPSADEEAWVRRCEMDHVTDYTDWANSIGKPLAEETEKALSKRLWWTQDKCGTDIRNAMQEAMIPSIVVEAMLPSIEKHDRSGRHDWYSTNKRP